VYHPGDHIIGAYVNNEKKFAFVEFRDMALCTACLALDGLPYMDTILRIKRPSDYVPLPAAAQPPIHLRMDELYITTSSSVPDGPNKVYVGNIPKHLSDTQARASLFCCLSV
jgi:splicing factor U2AF subunit